jgi:hypothetical protein
MTRLVRLTALFALLAPLCLAAGCQQGVGDRCQVQSDCKDGLLCVLPAGGTPQAGGTCQAPGTGGDMSVTFGPDLAAHGDIGAPPNDLTMSTSTD